MPFIDLNEQTPAGFDIGSFDIVIAGAGAAGILLAVSLSEKGRKVLILESGHFGEDEKKQQLNEVQQSGKKVENVVWGRKRAIGGTTIAWGGQSLPFSPLDFKYRKWVEASGWPISFEELIPYYKRANAFMGIDSLNYKNDLFPKIFLKDPGIDPLLLDYHLSKWADQPDFYLLYGDYLKANTTLLYNAHLRTIHRKENGVIAAIDLVNFAGSVFTCDPGILIIAAGGIETVRILLNNGLGGQSGLLGKGFMEHPCVEIGEVSTDRLYQLQKYFNTHVSKGKKYSIRLSLSEKFQEERQLLNCSASIMFIPPGSGFDPYSELRLFKKDFKISRLLKVSGRAGSILKSVWAYWKDRFYYKVNAVAKLVLMTEQEPARDSYISLGEVKDGFGQPKANICWNITRKTWDTVLAASEVLRQEIERLSFGKVELYPHISRENEKWLDTLSDVNHHMGGCRMSTARGEGVVNKDLQLWDTPNLYICSSAVFPTSSHSNPTLTLLALGIRLCDRLTK